MVSDLRIAERIAIFNKKILSLKLFRLVEKHPYYLIVSATAMLVFGLGLIFYNSPIEYDGAFNLQVAENLATGNSYTTNGSTLDGKPKLFDPIITTGPTVIFPTAIAISIFGNTILASRIWAIFILTILALIIFMLIKRIQQILNNKTNMLATFSIAFIIYAGIIILYLPSSMLVDTLGELTVTVLVLISTLLLSHRQIFWSGVFFGLAILTKLLSVIIIPAFILVLLLQKVHNKQKLKEIFIFLLSTSIPLVLFELYKLAIFRSISSYINNLKELVAYARTPGSGGGNGITIISIIREKVEAIATAYPGLFLLALLMLFVLGLAFIFIKTNIVIKSNQLKAFLNNPILQLLFFIAAITTVWWVAASNLNYIRHVVIGIASFYILAISVIASILHKLSRKPSLLMCLSFILIGIVIIIISALGTSTLRQKKVKQLSDATLISEHYKDKQLYNLGWWQNPEMQYLTGLKSLPYTPGMKDVDILMGSTHKNILPDDYAAFRENCTSIISISADYEVCKL